MKSAVYKKYGPPEVIKIAAVQQPLPQEDEILIKVFASTVNRTDCGFRSGEPFVARFWSGLFRPRVTILGCEYAGEVMQIGRKVTSFRVGQRVFGYNETTFGGHAEYVVVKQGAPIATIPDDTGYEEAAPITEGAHYALCDIRASKIKRGQSALVYGATGAIGSAAVQILKSMGVTVTAVCNTKSVELIESIGADEVLDYQTENVTMTDKRFDLVLDAVGKCSFKRYKRLMKQHSVYISTEMGKNAENILLAIVTPFLGGKKVLFPIPSITKEDVEYLKKLYQKGTCRPLIDRTYSLNEIVEAYRYVETGQKIGNVVIRVR